MSEETPLMKQYRSIKEQHGDAIVLFRLGDFYEMFGEDANAASPILQIALTTRDKNKENPMPMCGIPYFASETYISKLIKAGHKVAICEQVEDPKEAKGIVKREVVRVITPGTHSPGHPKRNNYILSLMPKGETHGIALADISTGEFVLYETTRPIEDELSRFEPVEVLIPEGLGGDIHYAETLSGHYTSRAEDWSFDYVEAYRALLEHFKVTSLEGYGCEGLSAAVSAGGALLRYVQGTLKEDLRFRKITSHNESEYMFLDAPTQKNLELTGNLKDGTPEGSLLWALDETLTPMGGRFLRNAILRPLLDAEEIIKRHGAVRYLVEDFELIDRLRRSLRGVQDLERLAQKVATGRANARDLVALKNSLSHVPEIRSALVHADDTLLKDSIGESLRELPKLSDLIGRSIEEHPPQSVKDGGIIKPGFHGEVDELRALSLNAKDFIASLEARERRETGISSLKVGYNKVFGYYIEVTKTNLGLVPPHYIRKQTLVSGERFMTQDLKEYEAKVLGAEEKVKPLENQVFLEILEEAGGFVPDIVRNSECLALVDFLISLAVAAKRHNYVMPRIGEDTLIRINNGRHPVLERLGGEERFIPNDSYIEGDTHRLLVITGPNMAGKSTYMRQVALMVLMAQAGSFVPADEATIGVADRIFTRIGASDFISKGQSTFMVEMIETANILNNATEKSLILLDEVGRGTSTFDGISIAWATAEYITRAIGARTLFATHYIELTELSHALAGEGIRNYNIAVKEWGEEIIFLRKIEEGPADKSYGIHVGRLAGLPDEVIEKAKEVLARLERQHMGESAGRSASQLELFMPPSDLIIKELMELKEDSLSPEEALRMIKGLRKKAGGLP
jgi:DNA mismatch repair protein MutS